MTEKKRQTMLRFRPDTERLIVLLQEKTGVSTKTSVVEMAIHEMARRHRLPTGARVIQQTEQSE